jgi:nucleoside-diphosphate-sugar epimerase
VNIGTGIETDNMEIVKRLYRVTGKEENILKIDRIRPLDSFKWVSDNRLLKSLGWKQEVPLDEGLLNTYEHYQRN